jgi:hypothetical protein
MTTTVVGGEIPVTGNQPASEVRSCDTTSLPICTTGQRFVKYHAVFTRCSPSSSC